MDLKVKVNYNNSTPIISVSGQIDVGNCIEVFKAVNEKIVAGEVKIILDFSKLSFLDSACLGMLLRSMDQVRGRGGKLIIIVNSFVERVLAVTGLTHHFNLCLTENEAFELLREEEVKRKSA